jgi:putative ABC transport system ATP-binding protein
MFGFLFRSKRDAPMQGDSASSALIQLTGVSKSYATPAGEFHALKGIDLQIGGGEFVAIIGKSGSGKSDAEQHDHRHRPPDAG